LSPAAAPGATGAEGDAGVATPAPPPEAAPAGAAPAAPAVAGAPAAAGADPEPFAGAAAPGFAVVAGAWAKADPARDNATPSVAAIQAERDQRRAFQVVGLRIRGPLSVHERRAKPTPRRSAYREVCRAKHFGPANLAVPRRKLGGAVAARQCSSGWAMVATVTRHGSASASWHFSTVPTPRSGLIRAAAGERARVRGRTLEGAARQYAQDVEQVRVTAGWRSLSSQRRPQARYNLPPEVPR